MRRDFSHCELYLVESDRDAVPVSPLVRFRGPLSEPVRPALAQATRRRQANCPAGRGVSPKPPVWCGRGRSQSETTTHLRIPAITDTRSG